MCSMLKTPHIMSAYHHNQLYCYYYYYYYHYYYYYYYCYCYCYYSYYLLTVIPHWATSAISEPLWYVD